MAKLSMERYGDDAMFIQAAGWCLWLKKTPGRLLGPVKVLRRWESNGARGIVLSAGPFLIHADNIRKLAQLPTGRAE